MFALELVASGRWVEGQVECEELTGPQLTTERREVAHDLVEDAVKDEELRARESASVEERRAEPEDPRAKEEECDR